MTAFPDPTFCVFIFVLTSERDKSFRPSTVYWCTCVHSKRLCRLRWHACSLTFQRIIPNCCCDQVCQLCLVTSRHSCFFYITFHLKRVWGFRTCTSNSITVTCKACYCVFFWVFFIRVSFDSMTSLHWNLITWWYDRALPPYWPTLPHHFHLSQSPHSSLHEFWL